MGGSGISWFEFVLNGCLGVNGDYSENLMLDNEETVFLRILFGGRYGRLPRWVERSIRDS
jgi:hypothetical protein